MVLHRNKYTHFLIFAIIGIGVLCIVGYAILKPTKAQNSANGTLYAFADALRLSDNKVAKSLVTSEQWERLDTWMLDHKAFKCPFSWQYSLDPDYNQPFWSCQSCDYNGATARCCNFSFRCTYPEGSYTFWIEEVVIRQLEKGYQVVEWGKVCEKTGKEEQAICQ